LEDKGKAASLCRSVFIMGEYSQKLLWLHEQAAAAFFNAGAS
jgi:hypothetical protein